MTTNNLLVRKNILLCLAIGWTTIIGVLCLIKFGKLPSIPVSGIDKYVHFTFHFIFTLLWGGYLWIRNEEWRLKQTAKIVIISLCYGVIIEFLQETCTTTRHADIFDVLANLSGAMTAYLIFASIKTIKNK